MISNRFSFLFLAFILASCYPCTPTEAMKNVFIDNERINLKESIDSEKKVYQYFEMDVSTDVDVSATLSDGTGGIGGSYTPVLYANNEHVRTYAYNDRVHGIYYGFVQLVNPANTIPNACKMASYRFVVGITSDDNQEPFSKPVISGDTVAIRVDMCNATNCVVGMEKNLTFASANP